MKYFLIGNFGDSSIRTCGQVSKSKNFKILLNEVFGIENMNLINTNDFNKTYLLKLRLVLKVLTLPKTHVFILPGHSALFLVFCLYIRRLFNKLEYSIVTIGGWYVTYYDKYSLLKFATKSASNIFVETKYLYSELEKRGISKIYVIPNFRSQIPTVPKDNCDRETFKMVYFGRVNELKGVLRLFDLEVYLSENFKQRKFSIDIYGEVAESFENVFKGKLQQSMTVKYLGILEYNEVLKTISAYDVSLFPTHYFTEGIPGTVVDSFLCGIPVVASMWRSGADIIDHGVNGFLYEFNDVSDELFKRVEELLNNGPLLDQMKYNIKANNVNGFVNARNILVRAFKDKNYLMSSPPSLMNYE